MVTALFGSSVRPFFVPTYTLPLASSCISRTRSPDESRAGAMSNWRPFSGGSSELIWIAAIAWSCVRMWPVE